MENMAFYGGEGFAFDTTLLCIKGVLSAMGLARKGGGTGENKCVTFFCLHFFLLIFHFFLSCCLCSPFLARVIREIGGLFNYY